MGNGAKAASKRERNAKDAKSAGGVSQLKANADAMNKKCTVCMQVFMQTTTKKILDEHASARHPGKTGKDCFGAVYDASKDAPAAK